MYPKDLTVRRIGPDVEKSLPYGHILNRAYTREKPAVEDSPKLADDYLAEMKPLFYSLIVLGRFPYRITDEGMYFKGLSVDVVYCLVAYGVQVGWTGNTGLIIFKQLISRGANYDETLFWFTTMVFLTLNLLIPFSYWLDSPNVVRYFKQWKKYQAEYATVMRGEKLSFSLKRFILSATLVNIPASIFTVLMENYFLVNLSWFDLMPYAFAYCSFNMVYLFWGSTCFEINRISDKLRHKAVQAVRGTSADGIKRCRCLWVGLSDLARGLGPSVGLTALLTTSVLSGCFILTCYALFAAIIHNQFSNNLLSLILLLPANTFHNFILVDTAHRTTQKVNLLLDAAKTSPPIITLNGFIKVDRTLFVSLLSTTLTYLVVLVQFKTSPDIAASYETRASV